MVVSDAFILGDNTRVTLQRLFLQSKTVFVAGGTLLSETRCCLNTRGASSGTPEKPEASMVYLLIGGYEQFFLQHCLS